MRREPPSVRTLGENSGRMSGLRNVFFAVVCILLLLLLKTRHNLPTKDDIYDPALSTTSSSYRKNNTTLSQGAKFYPEYVQLLEEAQRRADANFPTLHKLGELGVIIGPTEGNFQRYTFAALKNAKRIQTILNMQRHSNKNSSKFSPLSLFKVRVALMTSPSHIEVLNNCGAQSSRLEVDGFPIDKEVIQKACELWENGTLVDDLIPTVDEYVQDAHSLTSQQSIRYIMVELSKYRSAPYKTSWFLDSDAFPCPGFNKLFGVLKPALNEKYWQLPITAEGDFAIGLEQFAKGGHNNHFLPGPDRNALGDYFTYTTRNSGSVMFNFHRKLAHTLAEFIPLVAMHMHKNVSTPKNKVVNDQQALRHALYLFERLNPDYVSQIFPMHSSCRTYPGMGYAGIDGFENGMFPIQSDGKYCSDCSCTPCLIAHTAGTHFVTLNGSTGWGDDSP